VLYCMLPLECYASVTLSVRHSWAFCCCFFFFFFFWGVQGSGAVQFVRGRGVGALPAVQRARRCPRGWTPPKCASSAPGRGGSGAPVPKQGLKLTVLFYTVLYCTVQNCTVWYCTAMYCTVLYGTKLYCMVLSCTVLLHASPCCSIVTYRYLTCTHHDLRLPY